MKAYVADRSLAIGVAERDVEDPAPGVGRLVVEVHAASLNRGEVLHVAHYRLIPDGGPVGWDLAGVVVEGASDGVGPPVGTPVFGWSPRRGTWAERVCVDAGQVAPIPVGVSMSDAATLGVAALTALAALHRGHQPLLASRVLVTGPSGGVGTFAVQLAVLAGAAVTAVMRPDGDSADMAALLPAEVVVEEGLDPEGVPADLIVESVGGHSLAAALRRVGVGGTVVTLGRTVDQPVELPSGWFQKSAYLEGLMFARDFSAPGQTQVALERLGHLVSVGQLKTNVSMVVGRDDLPTAMAALLERRVRGKVTVRFH